METAVVIGMGGGLHGLTEVDEDLGQSFGPEDVFDGDRDEVSGTVILAETCEAHFEGGGAVADVGEFPLRGHPDNGIGLIENGSGNADELPD